MNEVQRRITRRMRRSWLAVVIVVPAALGVAWAALERSPGSGPSAPARVLTVLTRTLVAETGYQVPRLFTGQVEAARNSAVGFELDGMVAGIAVEEGDRVTAGQVLATLDSARLQARHNERAAALESADARLALARSTHRRIAGLVERKHASGQELDEARENRRALRAEVALARARLDSIAVELDKSRLLAPFDAVVTRRMVDEGRVLSAGQPVLELQETAPPEARVGVSRQLAATLVPGRRYPVSVNGRELVGVLRAVLPVRDRPTRSVEVILSLEVDPPALRSGDLVRLQLSRPVAAPGFWVPLDALTEGRRGTWSVYVASAADGIHRVERRSVQVLHQQGGQVYVQGALQVGEQLIDAGLHRVVPGQPVVAIDSETRGAGLESGS